MKTKHTRKRLSPVQRHPEQLHLVAALHLVEALAERIATELKQAVDHEGVELRTDALAIAWNARIGHNMVACSMSCPSAGEQLAEILAAAFEDAPSYRELADAWLSNYLPRLVKETTHV